MTFKRVSLLLLLAMIPVSAQALTLGAFVDGNGFLNSYSASGVSGGFGFGGGAGLIFPLRQRVALVVEGQYITEILNNNSAGNVAWIMVPASLSLGLIKNLHGLVGGYYSLGVSSSSSGASDGGLQGGLRFDLGPAFLDGRYVFGLKSDANGQDTRAFMAELGFKIH